MDRLGIKDIFERMAFKLKKKQERVIHSILLDSIGNFKAK